MLKLIDIVPDATPLVTPAQLFSWCRVDIYAETPEQDDNYPDLAFLLDAATSEAETILGFDLVPKQYEETFGKGSIFALSAAHVREVISVEEDGVAVEYELTTDGNESYIVLNQAVNSLTVEYIAGVPRNFLSNDILLAIRKLVKHYYDNRDNEQRKMLTSVEILLQRHKIYRLG